MLPWTLTTPLLLTLFMVLFLSNFINIYSYNKIINKLIIAASQPVPSAENISSVAVETVQNDTVISQNAQPVLDKILSESKDKLNFFLQFDHILYLYIFLLYYWFQCLLFHWHNWYILNLRLWRWQFSWTQSTCPMIFVSILNSSVNFSSRTLFWRVYFIWCYTI